ncbi:MAG: class I SAM-dependent methyltransferase [Gammaproteobacteria bacterium]
MTKPTPQDTFLLGNFPIQDRLSMADQFMSEVPYTPDATRQQQDTAKWARNPHLIKKIQPALKMLSDEIRVGDSVVDVGCGSGQALAYLQEHCSNKFEYFGIDISEIEIIRAREHFKDRGLFYNGSMEDHFLCDPIIFCSRLLIHLPSFEEHMRYLLRATKRTLILVLNTNGDWITRYSSDRGIFYMRAFSQETILETVGGGWDIEFHPIPNEPYTTVIARKHAT